MTTTTARNTTLRRLSGLGVVAIAVALAGAAAFACTPLAKVELSTPTARPGEVVSATGSAFVPAAAEVANPVILRWGDTDGAVLARVLPDDEGAISASFAVPQSDPGYHTVTATQVRPDGTAEPGGPARAVLQVLSPDTPGAGTQPGAWDPPPAPRSEPGGAIAAAAAMGFLALALVGAAGLAVAHHLRRPRPEPAKVARRS